MTIPANGHGSSLKSKTDDATGNERIVAQTYFCVSGFLDSFLILIMRLLHFVDNLAGPASAILRLSRCMNLTESILRFNRGMDWQVLSATLSQYPGA